MKLQKIILPSLLLTGALAVGSIGVHVASAQENQAYPPIVQRLAERFNLNQDEVQDVFEEVHAEREAEMRTRWEDRLDQAVNEGKITEEQKQMIFDKHEEMRAQFDALKQENLTPKERMLKMKELHEGLRNWAEEQGINLRELGPFVMKFKGFHKGPKLEGDGMIAPPGAEERFQIRLQ